MITEVNTPSKAKTLTGPQSLPFRRFLTHRLFSPVAKVDVLSFTWRSLVVVCREVETTVSLTLMSEPRTSSLTGTLRFGRWVPLERRAQTVVVRDLPPHSVSVFVCYGPGGGSGSCSRVTLGLTWSVWDPWSCDPDPLSPVPFPTRTPDLRLLPPYNSLSGSPTHIHESDPLVFYREKKRPL